MLIFFLKSYFGYILGVCGVFEVWMSLEMMRVGCFVFIINLIDLDFVCGDLDYLMGEGCYIDIEFF